MQLIIGYPLNNLLQNDIVMFYYSGHGFRYPNDASDYPRMWLKTGSDENVETNNLRIEEDVYDHIIKMGAGVNIVLSDCCNTTAAGDNGNFNNATVPVRQRVAHKKQSVMHLMMTMITVINFLYPVIHYLY